MKAHFLIFFFSFLFNFLSFPFSNLGFLILLAWLPQGATPCPRAYGTRGWRGALGVVMLHKRIPFKIHLEQKKFTKKFNSPSILHRKSLYFFFYPLGGIVPFYIGNPSKIHLEQFQTKIEIDLNFVKKSL